MFVIERGRYLKETGSGPRNVLMYDCATNAFYVTFMLILGDSLDIKEITYAYNKHD